MDSFTFSTAAASSRPISACPAADPTTTTAENTGTQLLITSCISGMEENGGGSRAEGGFPATGFGQASIEYQDLAMTSHTLDMIAGAPEGVQTTFELDTTSGSPEIKFLSRTAGPDGPLASV